MHQSLFHGVAVLTASVCWTVAIAVHAKEPKTAAKAAVSKPQEQPTEKPKAAATVKPQETSAAKPKAAATAKSQKATEPKTSGAKPAPRPAIAAAQAANDKARVLPPGQTPDDERLLPPRTLNDYHPWVPYSDKASWLRRAEQVRTQILVGAGLWPLPERTPLRPVIHGQIDRGEYTVEKVYFASMPGHYVTGNLYRPKGRTGRLPAMLSPHGHWRDGRFYDAGETEAQNQIKIKAETFAPNARYPLQARQASLARMGCVVFHYDMVGYADSKPLPHSGFNDVQAVLQLQNLVGLQTWNSIRALDFLASLPDVDPNRIGVSGASGGGTQTFLLCAVDARPVAAFPAVMVSTAMQGGCVCENCPLLRVGAGNIEFAAMTAPRPLGMSGADDWTIDIETKGLPELKKHFAMLGVGDRVMAKTYKQFGHNYNQVSREMMYDWMNRHLRLGLASIKERQIEPIAPKDLSVWDAAHPVPSDAKSLPELRAVQALANSRRLAQLWPQNAAGLVRYKERIGPALRALVVDELPAAGAIRVRDVGSSSGKGYTVDRLILSRQQPEPLFRRAAVPTAVYMPTGWNGTMVVWVDAEGHAALVDPATGLPGAELASLLSRKIAVLAPDVLLTGEFHSPAAYRAGPAFPEKNTDFVFGYNRSLLANRVHDILTAIGCAKQLYAAKSIDLVGFGQAGPWVVLAKAIAGPAVRRTAADFNGFSFATISRLDDPMMLPGGVRYGDLVGFAALCAPDDLYALGSIAPLNHGELLLASVYQASGRRDRLALQSTSDPQPRASALKWLAR